jgi:hypothetical protein
MSPSVVLVAATLGVVEELFDLFEARVPLTSPLSPSYPPKKLHEQSGIGTCSKGGSSDLSAALSPNGWRP